MGDIRKFIFTCGCTLASKFLFPESTEATTISPLSTASAIAVGRGPEFPIQEVQPYPTLWKRKASKSASSPARFKYLVTTFDPGAKEVFTQDFVRNPLLTAFLASNPAPTITAGFDVLVQLVMAAITTLPSLITNSLFFCLILTVRCFTSGITAQSPPGSVSQ